MIPPPDKTNSPEEIHALGSIDSTTFKLNHGTNKSMLTMNPFDEKQVCEFTDIFTLSISEIIFVD